MTKEELKTKYARVPTDFSEIEMLKDQLLDSGLLEAAQVSPEDAGKVLGVKEDGTIGVVEGGGSGGDVYLDGNSLVIPEQEGPQPVIEIDGVPYYHKQEFDVSQELEGTNYYDLLTAESVVSASSVSTMKFSGFPTGTWNFSTSLILASGYQQPTILLHSNTGEEVTYTSRAFTVVDTQREVTDDTKICLPTCSAYYGFLSEDGKTFISYYNLKSDGEAPKYVDSIKQGDAVIPLKDTRVPDDPHIVLPDNISATTTLNDIIALGLGIEMPRPNNSNVYYVEFTSNWYNGGSRGKGKATLDIRFYSNNLQIYIIFDETKYYEGMYHNKYTGNSADQGLGDYSEARDYFLRALPNYPSDLSNKTYVLKLVNGNLSWEIES